mmetsp:Transcript_7425/g.12485  ORF Transcript_7425/g.12485 Transcript_7425/m.12485 type:complete len:148 (+) Transcript_7425:87-530(+)
MSQFDPILIILQIIALQCLFYFSMGTAIVCIHLLFDKHISLEYFFSPNYSNLATVDGLAEAFCVLMASLTGAWLLSIIVGKSKKCVDFTFTVFFIHTVACTFYESFPLNWEWYLVMVISSVLMASVGEYWCALKEMEDIPLYSPVQT